MTKDEALKWLREKVPHYECEDCWYSCATLTCDDRRASETCDCGADNENAKREAVAQLLAAPEAATLTRYDMFHYEGEPGVAAEPSPTGEWVRWSDIAGSMNNGGQS